MNVDKIIRFDMSMLKARAETTTPEMERLGGRGLSSYIVHAEVPPTCHPLGRKNKIIFAPGLLGGTATPNSGRLSIGAKSPLTRGIKEANVGGVSGQKLARLGIQALVVEGEAEKGKSYVIKVDQKGASIIPAQELAGLGNYDTADRLKQQYGNGVGIICIGPAGEMRLAAASVACTDPEGRPSRHAARGGLGAVMGAKGVKAIVVDDTGTRIRPPVNKTAFTGMCKEFTEEILALKATKLLADYGTVGGLAFLSKFGSLPTRNFSTGSFEGDTRIGGKGVAETNASRGGSFGHVCMPGCVVRCSNVMHDENGYFLTAGFEFESCAMLGANLGINDLDAVMRLEKKCDDLGLDTMEMGVALGVAHDAGLLAFGDGNRAMELVAEIEKGSVLGRVLGQGAEVTARVFGISRVPVVKGQGIPAHDPRKQLGTGVSYATSTQGADHTGVIIFNAVDTEEMIKESRRKQINTAAYDSLGLCQMTEPNPEVMAGLLSCFYGLDWSPDDVISLGRSTLKKELAFNRKAGLGPETDKLPEFMIDEPLAPSESVFHVSDDVVMQVLTY